MPRFLWDPDVNVTRRRPAGMTSKPDPNDGDVPPAPTKGKIIKSKQSRKVRKEKSRLAVQGTEKRQSTALMKHWKYRNFRRCGHCGAFDTYKSMNPQWTRTTRTKKLSDLFPHVPPEFKEIKLSGEGANAAEQTCDVEIEVTYWCYKCGAINDAVTAKYEGVEVFEPKGRQTQCAECGREISFARGDKAWRTGEQDGNTGRPDYRCDPCEQKRMDLIREAKKGGEEK